MDTNIVNIKIVSVLLCIKQHLSNIWSWIHENVKQHWEKSVAYKKKSVLHTTLE